MFGSSVNPIPPLTTSTPITEPKSSVLILSSAPLDGSIITLSLGSYPNPGLEILDVPQIAEIAQIVQIPPEKGSLKNLISLKFHYSKCFESLSPCDW